MSEGQDKTEVNNVDNSDYTLEDLKKMLASRVEGDLKAAGKNLKTMTTLVIVAGILLVVLGCICCAQPESIVPVIGVIVGIGFIADGILEIYLYSQLHNLYNNNFWFIFTGIVSIIAGVFMAANPNASGVATAWIFACATIAIGFMGFFSSIMMGGSGSRNWFATMLLSLLMVAFGIMMFTEPAMLPLYLGVVCIFRGTSLIVEGFQFSYYLSDLKKRIQR